MRQATGHPSGATEKGDVTSQAVRTMRLRYPARCAECRRPVERGRWRTTCPRARRSGARRVDREASTWKLRPNVLTPFAVERGIPQPPVRAALVFVEGEFGLLPSPLTLDGVWIGWGRSIRKRLRQESTGRLPVADLAKRLARELRAG